MTARPEKKGKRTQAQADETRELMMDAALRTFARKGFEGTSLRNVADEAGVSHALFRKHFGNKDTLWRTVVDHGVNRYAIALQERAGTSVGSVSTIQKLVRTMLAVTADHPDLVRLMVLEGSDLNERTEYISEVWDDVGDQYRGLFYDVQGQGELTAFIDSDMFLFVLTSGMIPLALPGLSSAILGEDISTKEQREQHTDRLLQVLLG